jgi:GAF domain-containing protein
VIAQERTLWTEDILADARFPLGQPMRALLAAHDIRGILAAPVVVGQRVFGVFYLFPEPGRAFGPDEADFFSALTLLIGVAVEAGRASAPDWATPPA